VNSYLYAYLAMDMAQQRTREAEERFLEHTLRAGAPDRASGVRSLAARAVAGVSRGSASIVRRLDDRVADDLGRTLAPAE
jgi:hypothetical protein